MSRLLVPAVGRLRELGLQAPAHLVPPLSPLTVELLRLAVEGRRHEALRLAVGEVEYGVTPAELLVEVVEPALVEVARRYAAEEVDPTQERHCRVVLEQVMAMLFPPRLDATAPLPRAVVVSLADGPPRVRAGLVADLLERQGWRVEQAGTSARRDDQEGRPLAARVDRLLDEPTDVVVVAVGAPAEVPAVRRVAARLAAEGRTAAVGVVAIGRPFVVAPGLVPAVGAAGTAGVAGEVVALCERLVVRAGAGPVAAIPSQRSATAPLTGSAPRLP